MGQSSITVFFSNHDIFDIVYLPLDPFQADVDGNGSIDYVEFITATMHRHKLERDEHLFKAFQYFDKDNSG